LFIFLKSGKIKVEKLLISPCPFNLPLADLNFVSRGRICPPLLKGRCPEWTEGLTHMNKIKIPVEVSARHIHLSQKDLDKLFGKNYVLYKIKDLSQPGKFAAKEEVKIITPPSSPTFEKGGRISLHVLGPVRPESQIELSLTDAIRLEVDAPMVVSGNLKNVKSFIEVKGPKGKAKVKAIVAERHIHCSPEEARAAHIKNGQKVSMEVVSGRGLVFNNIIVRVDKNFKLSCHIDTDEANACGLGKVRGVGYLI